jgi:hypothetical protein
MEQKRKPKYKVGDVLTTRLGNIFTIKGITKGIVASTVTGDDKIIKAFYELEMHPHQKMSVYYIDNSQHICPATKAGKLLFQK